MQEVQQLKGDPAEKPYDSFDEILREVDSKLMENMDAAKKIHEAYLLCKETFAPNKIVLNASVNIDNEEESQFFRIVSNFFIQQRQKEIIKR